MEKRWAWFGQGRDALATVAGAVIVAEQVYRHSYDPIAMGFVGLCWGIATAGTAGRALIGRWENERKQPPS